MPNLNWPEINILITHADNLIHLKNNFNGYAMFSWHWKSGGRYKTNLEIISLYCNFELFDYLKTRFPLSKAGY